MSDQEVEVNEILCYIRDLHRCTSHDSEVEAATSDSKAEKLLIQLLAQAEVNKESGSGDDADEVDRELPRSSSRIRRAQVCDLCD